MRGCRDLRTIVIAPVLQVWAQIPHPIQRSASMAAAALPAGCVSGPGAVMVMAAIGHAFEHREHPVHSCRSQAALKPLGVTAGREYRFIVCS